MCEEKEKELIQYILQSMLDQHFVTKTKMAKELNVELRTIQKTFSQLEKNTSKGGSIVLEKILVYCARNSISVDKLMATYKEKQSAVSAGKKNVDFPMPQGLDERLMGLYHHADAYVQCVSGYLCPYCKRECSPSQGDRWLWNDCMVSRISMIMLSHILLVQDEVKARKAKEKNCSADSVLKADREMDSVD